MYGKGEMEGEFEGLPIRSKAAFEGGGFRLLHVLAPASRSVQALFEHPVLA